MSKTVEDILSHHGVKGMKWGVRRAQKKAARADRRWQKNIYKFKGAIDVHNHVADHMNSRLPALNAKHPKANINESVQSKATRAYIREYESLQLAGYKAAVEAVHGTSPSGSYRARYVSDSEGHRVVVERTDAEHAHQETQTYSFDLETEDGKIVLVKSVRGEMEQSDPVLEFIQHHGVKGMKWGRRKAKSSTGRTQFKKSPSRLSDEELNKRVKRMETEKRYNSLNAGDKSKGREFVEGVLTSSGRGLAKTLVTGAAAIAIKSALERSGRSLPSELAKRLG